LVVNTGPVVNGNGNITDVDGTSRLQLVERDTATSVVFPNWPNQGLRGAIEVFSPEGDEDHGCCDKREVLLVLPEEEQDAEVAAHVVVANTDEEQHHDSTRTRLPSTYTVELLLVLTGVQVLVVYGEDVCLDGMKAFRDPRPAASLLVEALSTMDDEDPESLKIFVDFRLVRVRDEARRDRDSGRTSGDKRQEMLRESDADAVDDKIHERQRETSLQITDAPVADAVDLPVEDIHSGPPTLCKVFDQLGAQRKLRDPDFDGNVLDRYTAIVLLGYSDEKWFDDDGSEDLPMPTGPGVSTSCSDYRAKEFIRDYTAQGGLLFLEGDLFGGRSTHQEEAAEEQERVFNASSGKMPDKDASFDFVPPLHNSEESGNQNRDSGASEGSHGIDIQGEEEMGEPPKQNEAERQVGKGLSSPMLHTFFKDHLLSLEVELCGKGTRVALPIRPGVVQNRFGNELYERLFRTSVPGQKESDLS
ncbi:unnamed protein product, partial [Amoebophrya sp. A25]